MAPETVKMSVLIKDIPLFAELDIETVGSCNRTCPTCMRNSYPNRKSVAERFGKQQRLPTKIIHKVIDDAVNMGYTGGVNLQHFNEPLQDPRIADIARYAKQQGVFEYVMMHTNADLMTPRKAAALDGVLDRMTIALYNETGGAPMPQPQMDERKEYLRSLFSHTDLWFTDAVHLVTHFSPYVNLKEAIAENRPLPCRREVQLRLIVDYRGEMLLCCEDIVGLWNLGNVADNTLEELWFSEKHREIVKTLAVPGGREAYGFCRTCPRPDYPWSPMT